MNQDKQPTCAELVRGRYDGRVEDINTMLERMVDMDATDEEREEAYTEFNEFGLCFDYVEADTFHDQPDGYFRYQLSWGGPGDEFRFYVDQTFQRVHRAEYWYMNWFDGAKVNVEAGFAQDLWFQFSDFAQGIYDKEVA